MNVVISMQFGSGIIHIILQQQIYVEIESIVGASIVPVVWVSIYDKPWVFHHPGMSRSYWDQMRESPLCSLVCCIPQDFVSELHACMQKLYNCLTHETLTIVILYTCIYLDTHVPSIL